MPYTPKVPRPYDFCGCPPCHICFDFVKPAPSQKIPEDAILPRDLLTQAQEESVVPGLVKMTEEILQKDYDKCTAEEKLEIKNIAQEIHERNAIRKLKGEPPPEVGSTFQDEEDIKWMTRAITQQRIAKEQEKKYEEERKGKTTTLDQMGWGEQQRLEEQEGKLQEAAVKETEKEKKAKKEKELQDAFNRMLPRGSR